VQTSLEPAFTILENVQSYSDFVRTAILRRHLAEIPDLAQNLLLNSPVEPRCMTHRFLWTIGD